MLLAKESSTAFYLNRDHTFVSLVSSWQITTFSVAINNNCYSLEADLTITLYDGRVLGYAQYGDSTGFPIFYFHGGQESRLSSRFMDSIALGLGIRIISPDRPGIGLSSFQENRSFPDWSSDVEELADSLKINHFSIFGLSGGAPHVLACLQTNSERIDRASIISGATPYDYKGTLKGMWFPVKIIHWFAGMKNEKKLRKYIQKDYEGLLNNPDKRMKQFQKYLPKPDKELMIRNPEFGWDFIQGSIESYKQGIDGVVQEWKLYVRNWNMDLRSVEYPVSLWYGNEDKMAPVNRGRYYKEQLPNSTLHLIEHEAHFSLIRNHLREILIDLKTTHSIG